MNGAAQALRVETSELARIEAEIAGQWARFEARRRLTAEERKSRDEAFWQGIERQLGDTARQLVEHIRESESGRLFGVGDLRWTAKVDDGARLGEMEPRLREADHG